MDFFENALGVVVLVLCIASPQAKKKWQILLLSAVANFLSGINFLIFVGFTSAFVTNMLAVVQTATNIFKSIKNKDTGIIEKVIYLILYAALSLSAYKTPIDLLVVLASLLFALAVFCKKELHYRYFMLCNSAAYIVYNILVGSTNLYSQIFAFISVTLAIIRYKNKE